MFRISFFAAVCCLVGVASAQNVTVGLGGTGDYSSINAAIAAVNTEDSTPAVITILDDGPYFESRIILNENTTTATKSIRIHAAEGKRPVVVVSSTADGAIYIRKQGEPCTIEDIVLIPAVGAAAQAAIKLDNINFNEGQTFDDVSSVTLRNITVTSNDGLDNPVGSLDGLTPPVVNASTVSFTDEGVFLPSLPVDRVAQGTMRFIYLYDVVITGLTGSSGTDGIRSQMDAAAGSETVIGPGCVISYNNTNRELLPVTNNNAGIQPGGNVDRGGDMKIRVEGTQDKPVMIINNNFNGISISGDDPANTGLISCKWVIIANNTLSGINVSDTNSMNTLFENVTIANNGGYVLKSPSLMGSSFSFSNTIAAGMGDPNLATNVIRTAHDDPFAESGAVITFEDSAIVLNGPYTLNTSAFGGDGLEEPSPTNVVKTNVISADPQFISLDPAAGGFAVVANQAYATAGPGGQPLVGGGSMAQSSVEDWQLF